MRGALILARVSTRDQLNGHSIPTQLEACRAYAARINVPVVGEVIDNESGATLQREGLDEVRRRLALGEADTLIVHTTSRLTRDPADLFTVRKELQRLGAALHVVQRGGVASTPEQELGEDFEAVLAKYERANLRERSMRGRRGKIAAGKLGGGGPAPYGYRWEGAGRETTLAIYEPEAVVVRRMYTLYTIGCGNGPMNIMMITRQINDEGHRGRQGKPWHVSTVRAILRDPVYAGTFYANRLRSITKTCAVLRPREEWVPLPAPVLLDAILWDAAQARLAVGKIHSPRNARTLYLLRTRLRCICGVAMRSSRHARNANGTHHYICNSSTYGKGHCGARNVAGPRLDTLIWTWVRQTVLAPQTITKAIEAQRNQPGPDQARQESAQRAVADLEAQREKLLGLYLRGIFSLDELERSKRALDAALVEARAQLLPPAPAPITPTTAEALIEYAGVIRDGLDDLTEEERQRVMELLAVKVVVTTVEGGWNVHATSRLRVSLLALHVDKQTQTGSRDKSEVVVEETLYLTA